jgi:hypothetical protein
MFSQGDDRDFGPSEDAVCDDEQTDDDEFGQGIPLPRVRVLRGLLAIAASKMKGRRTERTRRLRLAR